MYVAIKNNNEEIINYLLSSSNVKYDLNLKIGLSNGTVLHQAIINRNLKIVKILCSLHDIDINSKIVYENQNVREEKTGLHLAIEINQNDIAKYLLSLPNIDVNDFYISKYDKKYNEKTALQLAIEKNNTDITKILLQRKDIIVKNLLYNEDKTLLQIAVENRNLDIIKLLLDIVEIDVNCSSTEVIHGDYKITKRVKNALHIAVSSGNLNIVES